MRRLIAIVLLLLYILGTTELREIAHFPVLFEHFAEHKGRNKDVSIIGFIVLHYFSGDIKDSDYQRDQQLPFKRAHCEEVSVEMIIPAESFVVSLVGTSCATPKMGMHVSPFNSSLHQFTIWQPPRA